MTPAEERIQIWTTAGHVMLLPGTYAVRCPANCAAMLLTVVHGHAVLRTTSEKPGIMVNAGEYARLPAGGDPEPFVHI